MLKNFTAVVVWGVLVMMTSPSFAQIDNIDDVLQAGIEDAEVLTRSYLKPLPSGFGSGINSGWIISAEPHQPLGFDLQIRGTMAFIPATDETYNLQNLDLQHISAVNDNQTVSPTIGGRNETGPLVEVTNQQGEQIASFNLPKGSGYPVVPAAMIQAGVGLVQNTDLKVRYIPESSYEDVSFSMKGIGLKHGINQWLPGGELLPVNISVLGGYSQTDVHSGLDLQPEGFPRNEEAATADFSNQRASMKLKTFTVKAFVGKSLPFLSVYGGIGYETSTMDVAVEGNYPINATIQNENFPDIDAYDVVSDPFSYTAEGENTMSLIGGASIKLAFLRLFGEFKLAKYPTGNAGIGISFR